MWHESADCKNPNDARPLLNIVPSTHFMLLCLCLCLYLSFSFTSIYPLSFFFFYLYLSFIFLFLLPLLFFFDASLLFHPLFTFPFSFLLIPVSRYIPSSGLSLSLFICLFTFHLLRYISYVSLLSLFIP